MISENSQYVSRATVRPMRRNYLLKPDASWGGGGAGGALIVINLKIAKALGLTIPQSLLLRADEMMQ